MWHLIFSKSIVNGLLRIIILAALMVMLVSFFASLYVNKDRSGMEIDKASKVHENLCPQFATITEWYDDELKETILKKCREAEYKKDDNPWVDALHKEWGGWKSAVLLFFFHSVLGTWQTVLSTLGDTYTLVVYGLFCVLLVWLYRKVSGGGGGGGGAQMHYPMGGFQPIIMMNPHDIESIGKQFSAPMGRRIKEE